jgi:hypothetical protein
VSRGIYPRFALHEARSEDVRWLANHNGLELQLEDITDICATMGVSAHLYDRRSVDAVCLGRVDGRGQVELYDQD